MPAWIGLAVAALLLLAPAHGEAQSPAQYPQSYRATVEASRIEGKMVVYSTVAGERLQPLLAGFKHAYPWLTVQILQLDIQPMLARYAAEKAARGTTADLMLGGDLEAWRGFAAGGEVLPYASPEAATLPAEAMPAPGLYAVARAPAVMAAIPKAVTSKSAAMLLLDYMLSAAGQAALAQGGLTPSRRARL